jgi:S1-C subfamily serine protease
VHERDDDGLDHGELGPPLLPPDDRLWRHPSELGPRTGGASSTLRREAAPLIAVAALASAVSVLLTLGVAAAVGPLRKQKIAIEQVVPPMTMTTSSPGTPDAAAIAERVRPAVTRVEADDGDGRRLGSGVLVRSDGMMLTTHNLVGDAQVVHVLLHDGRELPGTVLGSDPETDLAVVDVAGEAFPTATLGSASYLKIGLPAITIGSPAAAGGPVVSVGVVSTLGQQVENEGVRLLDLIQTDAPLLAGCSGGAVVDQNGAVIGIATAVRAAEPGMTGYAVPIDIARLVADQLVATGKVTRAWLGIDGEDVDPPRAKELGIDGGAVVKKVKEASPAAAAGVGPGDIITAVDGRTVTSMTALVLTLRSRKPGDVVALSMLRSGEKLLVAVTLAERPSGGR